MRQEVMVIGAGGHGKSLVGVLLAMGIHVVGILDDDASTWGRQVLGVPVQGSISESVLQRRPVTLGLGDNGARRAVVERLPQVEWASVIHPSVYLNPSAEVGQGVVLFPGAVIGAEVRLGGHVIVSSQCTIGHDAVLGDYAHAAPGVQVAGEARIGSGVMLGIGSVVCPGVKIGEWSTLAAGAVAAKDLTARCTAFGVPAVVRAGV